MQKVQLVSDGIRTRAYVNGKEIDCLTAISFEQTVDTVPTFTFDVCGNPELVFDDALVNINFTPSTVESAVAVICRALNTDAVLYDGFHASILSAIEDAPCECYGCELATRILDRIVGRD